MVEGTVSGRAARVELRVRFPGGRTSETVTAVIDTGFDGGLTLPAEAVDRLKLDWLGLEPWTLADGRSHDFDIYSAEVFWQDRWKPVTALETGRAGLIGMKLLEGFRVAIDVAEGGRASIVPLPGDSEDE